MTEPELLRRLDQTIEHNSQVIERLDQVVERNSHFLEIASRGFERMVQAQNRLDRTVNDLRDQIAANTAALLRLIDRLGPEPAS